jgi:parallel beta helix pectate lyase-like protein
LGRLVRSLRRGRSGCLLRGRYVHRRPLLIRRPRVTLRSARGAHPIVDGPLWIEPSAVGARISGLRLTAHDPIFNIPLKVQADRARITRNTITTAPNSICVLVGSARTANGVVIEGNRIRNCGEAGKYDHLIYLQSTRDTVIRWNVLAGNPGGWAVHLYPDADRTLIEHNVIDGNLGGVVFAGDSGNTSDQNLVTHNAITFSGPRWNVEGSWGGSAGEGNSVEHNCLFSLGPGAPAGIGDYQAGFTASENPVLMGSPYLARERRDFRFQPGNVCLALVGDLTAHLRR